MAADAPGRIAASWPSGHPARPGSRYRFNQSSRDELAHRRFRDTDMAADANEPNATFGNEATREPLGSAEQLGDLSDSQMPLYGDFPPASHHAALTVAETS